ncbi:MAG: hypothetical protein KG012_20795 [Deltaproteobacteria bacterium]|nr:hypothetical protein [Deltaproteobacteria bacterium]
MGYAFISGNCWTCGTLFTFNPLKVPSIRDSGGVRQAICGNCVRFANKMRIEKGMDPFPVPADAYEAVDENELQI